LWGDAASAGWERHSVIFRTLCRTRARTLLGIQAKARYALLLEPDDAFMSGTNMVLMRSVCADVAALERHASA
jgi:hypothetical protein